MGGRDRMEELTPWLRHGLKPPHPNGAVAHPWRSRYNAASQWRPAGTLGWWPSFLAAMAHPRDSGMGKAREDLPIHMAVDGRPAGA